MHTLTCKKQLNQEPNWNKINLLFLKWLFGQLLYGTGRQYYWQKLTHLNY